VWWVVVVLGVVVVVWGVAAVVTVAKRARAGRFKVIVVSV